MNPLSRGFIDRGFFFYTFNLLKFNIDIDPKLTYNIFNNNKSDLIIVKGIFRLLMLPFCYD